MTPLARSTLAALLLAVPVTAEAAGVVDGDTVAGHVGFAGCQLAGWLLAGGVVRDLARRTAAAGRWAPRLLLAGVACQVMFAAAYLVSVGVTGEPWEGAFVAFLLGFLLLTAGGVAGAVRLRRAAPLVAAGLAGVAVLGLVAVLVGDSVVHEVALVGSYLAWILVGTGRTTDRDPERVSAGSRGGWPRRRRPSPRPW